MIKLREKSHHYLRIGLYLLDNIKRATVYVTNDCTKRKLLNYICKLYHILSKFTDVYFGYTYLGVTNKFAEDCDAEIKQGCVFVQELCRIIKIRVSVLLRTDVKSQEIIHYILRKVTSKLQASLCISTTGIKKCTTCAMSTNQNKLLQQLLLNNSLIFSNN